MTMRTTVPLGDLLVEVEAPDEKELLREVSRVRELHAAGEGTACTPFHRRAKKFDFYGLRRESDGYEVFFGQHKEDGGAGALFAYRKRSEGYVGFQPPRIPRPGDEPDPASSAPEDAPTAREDAAPATRPSRAHAAMLYYIRRHADDMKRGSWQVTIDGRPHTMRSFVGSAEGWDRLVQDHATAWSVVERIQSYDTDAFDVEAEHEREERRRAAPEPQGVRTARARSAAPRPREEARRG